MTARTVTPSLEGTFDSVIRTPPGTAVPHRCSVRVASAGLSAEEPDEGDGVAGCDGSTVGGAVRVPAEQPETSSRALTRAADRLNLRRPGHAGCRAPLAASAAMGGLVSTARTSFGINESMLDSQCPVARALPILESVQTGCRGQARPPVDVCKTTCNGVHDVQGALKLVTVDSAATSSRSRQSAGTTRPGPVDCWGVLEDQGSVGGSLAKDVSSSCARFAIDSCPRLGDPRGTPDITQRESSS